MVADIRATFSADGCEEVDIKKQMKVVQLRLILVVEVGREEADPPTPKPQHGKLAKDKVCRLAL